MTMRRFIFAGLLAVTATAHAQDRPATAIIGARIDHVAIHVRDVDASANFYADLFGLREIPAAAAKRRWFALGDGIALHIIGDRTEPVADDRSVHLAITTRTLEPVVATLRSRGIAFTDFAGRPGQINSSRNDGVHQVFFRDPDGYWIEVNDALAQRPR